MADNHYSSFARARNYTQQYELDSVDSIVTKQEDGYLGYISAGEFATTGSNIFIGGQILMGNLTVVGGISANTYNVETISVSHYSASTNFGLDTDDIHTFTGSVKITGSLDVIGSTTTLGNTIISGGIFVSGGINGQINATNGVISSSAQITTFGFISSSQTINTASFATTGSNTFNGNQTITGSLSVSGSFTSNLSQNNLFFGDSNNRSVATHYSQTPFNYRLYSQIESSTPITNTTNSGSLLGNGIGTLSVPANSFQIGDSFQAVMHGGISSRDSKGFTINVKTDGIILASTGEIDTVDLYPQTTHWTLNLNFVIRGVGSAGTAQIVTMGNFIFNRETTNANLYGKNFHYINSSSFDTTIDNTLYITGQWTKGTIGTQESINSDMFNLTKIF